MEYVIALIAVVAIGFVVQKVLTRKGANFPDRPPNPDHWTPPVDGDVAPEDDDGRKREQDQI